MAGFGTGIGLSAKIQPPNFAGVVERASVLKGVRDARKKENDDKNFDKYQKDLTIDPSKYHPLYQKEAQRLTADWLNNALTLKNQGDNYQNQLPQSFLELQNKLNVLQVESKNLFDYHKSNPKDILKDSQTESIIWKGNRDDINKYAQQNPQLGLSFNESGFLTVPLVPRRDLGDIMNKEFEGQGQYKKVTKTNQRIGNNILTMNTMEEPLIQEKSLAIVSDPVNIYNYTQQNVEKLKGLGVDFSTQEPEQLQKNATIVHDAFLNDVQTNARNRGVPNWVSQGDGNGNGNGNKTKKVSIINDGRKGILQGLTAANNSHGKYIITQEQIDNNIIGTSNNALKKSTDPYRTDLYEISDVQPVQVRVTDLKDYRAYDDKSGKHYTLDPYTENYIKNSSGTANKVFVFNANHEKGGNYNVLSQKDYNTPEKTRNAKQYGTVQLYFQVPQPNTKEGTVDTSKPITYKDVYLERTYDINTPDKIGIFETNVLGTSPATMSGNIQGQEGNFEEPVQQTPPRTTKPTGKPTNKSKVTDPN